MPYLSEKQRAWAHTEAGKKALGGEKAVHEWDKASAGKKLPETANTQLAVTHQPERNDLPKDLTLEEESKSEVVPHDEHNSDCPGPLNCNCNKTMTVKNASQYAKRYFGLHFAPGVAQYKEAKAEPYNIYLNQDTINKMDQSFTGKPVFVNHKNDVTPKSLDQADGYVVKSFFNQTDGKQWCEFLIVSDAGHDAILKGFQLSNCYQVKNESLGGEWHAVPYIKEVIDAEYEHLALVPNPRYKESVILTPDEFKRYNERKGLELNRLTNSQGATKTMLNFFKRSKVENTDLDTMSVLLPRSNKETTLAKLVNDADGMEMKDKKMADPDHMVKMNDGQEMSVAQLMQVHEATCAKLMEAEGKAESALKEGEKTEVGLKAGEPGDDEQLKSSKEQDAKSHDAAHGAHEMKNVDSDKKVETKDTAKDDVKVEAKPSEVLPLKDSKKMNDSNFNKLKSAEKTASLSTSERMMNGVELGKQLFGSK